MHSAAMWMKPSRPRQKRIEKAGPGAAGTLGRCRTAESFCTQSAGCRRSLNFENCARFPVFSEKAHFFLRFPLFAGEVPFPLSSLCGNISEFENRFVLY